MNMMYNKATGTVMILDNSTTGMTGHQDHAATGKTLLGEPTYAIDIPALCRACLLYTSGCTCESASSNAVQI